MNFGRGIELFLFFAFGHAAWAGAGCRYESCVGGKWRDHSRVDVVCAASWIKDNNHACSFELSTRLGLPHKDSNGLINVDLGTRVCVVTTSARQLASAEWP